MEITMTAPTLIRPQTQRPTPSAWLTGIHRIEEGTIGSLDARVDFVRNALALVQPMSVLEVGSDPALRERLAREGHAVYAAGIGQAAAASFPSQVQRIAGVTHYFGYGDPGLAVESLPNLAARLSPWGWMGLKVLDRDNLAHWLPDEEVLHRDGAWFRLKFRFDRRTGILDVTSRPLTRPQPSLPQPGPSRLRLRAFTVTEIAGHLERSGLRLEAVFGGLQGEAPDKGSKALWIAARKSGGR
jgi:hypothetical protein